MIGYKIKCMQNVLQDATYPHAFIQLQPDRFQLEPGDLITMPFLLATASNLVWCIFEQFSLIIESSQSSC